MLVLVSTLSLLYSNCDWYTSHGVSVVRRIPNEYSILGDHDACATHQHRPLRQSLAERCVRSLCRVFSKKLSNSPLGIVASDPGFRITGQNCDENLGFTLLPPNTNGKEAHPELVFCEHHNVPVDNRQTTDWNIQWENEELLAVKSDLKKAYSLLDQLKKLTKYNSTGVSEATDDLQKELESAKDRIRGQDLTLASVVKTFADLVQKEDFPKYSSDEREKAFNQLLQKEKILIKEDLGETQMTLSTYSQNLISLLLNVTASKVEKVQEMEQKLEETHEDLVKVAKSYVETLLAGHSLHRDGEQQLKAVKLLNEMKEKIGDIVPIELFNYTEGNYAPESSKLITTETKTTLTKAEKNVLGSSENDDNGPLKEREQPHWLFQAIVYGFLLSIFLVLTMTFMQYAKKALLKSWYRKDEFSLEKDLTDGPGTVQKGECLYSKNDTC